MLKDFFLFELKYRATRPATYVYFFIFFLMTFLAVTTDVVRIGGSTGRVIRNAPIVINNFSVILTIFGIFVVAAVMGVPVHRDREFQTDAFFFTYPFKKEAYLAGRFLGSFVVLLFIFVSIYFAVLLGSFMPWLKEGIIGRPFSFGAYWTSFLFFMLPNLFFAGTIFFGMVALSRNIVASYSGSAILFITYLISLTLASDMEDRQLAALLDPFGLQAANLQSRYWTVTEQNTHLLALKGAVLYNRLLWTLVAIALLGYTFWKAKLVVPSPKGKKQGRLTEPMQNFRQAARVAIPKTRKFYSLDLHLNQVFSMGLIDFKNVVKDILFLSILLAGLIFLLLDGWYADRAYGTLTYPVTYNMLTIKNGGFFFLAYGILIFYTGELVWKERSIKFAEIADAFPVPNWLFYASKVLAILLICTVLVSVVMLAGILIQTAKGFTNYQPELYFKELFLITLPDYLLFALLSFFVHVVVNQKFLGFFMTITFWVLLTVMSFLGLQHPLYRYSALPDYTISDMNGYGPFVEGIFWFTVYWACFALIFTVLGNLFWPRGKETTLRNRLQSASLRFKMPVKVSLGISIMLWLFCGGWIFYNTNILQHFRSEKSEEALMAGYEKKYKQYENLPQPFIQSVKINLDIYPENLSMYLNGTYSIKNESKAPIDSLHILVPPEVSISTLTIDRDLAQASVQDSTVGYYIYPLHSPLNPGETANLSFDLEYSRKGFAAITEKTNIAYNGTFIQHSLLPSFGYDPSREIQDEGARKAHGLGPVGEMPPPNNNNGLQHNLLSHDAHWIEFSAVVSTTSDQMAISPGYLQKEWVEGNQRYFQYRIDTTILHYYSFLSANYEVAREKWLSPQGKEVNIEIYHHPQHHYNIKRMTKAMKQTLTYCSEQLSAYQFNQMRIVEYPRYQRRAQSFPGTVPYSEGLGFIMKVENSPNAIDYPFYVTAHEVAHQWWGHQVIGGHVAGSMMLAETLSQYIALMVMEQEYGKENMKRFLRYELDRYLIGRSSESHHETPLLTATDRRYVLHHKGSLAMYALKEYIGEKTLNAALRRYVQNTAYQGPPYTNSLEFYDYLQTATPDSLQYLLEDLFQKIAIYENFVLESAFRKLPNGKFEVALTLSSKKFYADSLGVEIPVIMNDWIEVGVFAQDRQKGVMGKPLYLKKHRFSGGTTQLTLTVDEKPARTGIDPYHLLIDRNPDDNMASFTF